MAVARIAGVLGQTAKVYRLFLVAAGATNLTIKDGATALTGAIALPANGSITLDFDGEPWFTGSPNTNFIINSSAAVQISGRIYFIQN